MLNRQYVMVRLKNKKSNPNPKTAFCTGHSRTFIIEFTPSRAWYNGSTSASQAEDEGSIPFARTKKSNRPCVGFIFWIVGDGREPDKVAPATQGSERSVHRTRSERGPPKSPRAPAIGLISAGNYTFPSPAPPFASARLRVATPHVRRAVQAKECHTKS